MKIINDLDVRGKRVLLRADFNVPMDSEKNITDDIRIRMVLPTIRLLLEKGAKLIICSHCGSAPIADGQKGSAILTSVLPRLPRSWRSWWG